MDIKELFSALQDFDLNNFIPKLDTVLGQVQLIAQLAVMIGPLVILALGLWYYFLPPKEANHTIGFRCFWGMSSIGVWRFTQRLAGIVYGALGILLTVVMFFISNGFAGKEMLDMIWSACVCLMWELGLVLAAVLAIHIVVIVLYDFNGQRRSEVQSETQE